MTKKKVLDQVNKKGPPKESKQKGRNVNKKWADQWIWLPKKDKN